MEKTMGGRNVVVDEAVRVNIRRSNGLPFSVKISLRLTVAQFKGLLNSQDHTLAYNGHFLVDEETLSYYGLKTGDTVHILPGSANVDGASSSSSSYTDLDSAFRGTRGLAGFAEVHRHLAQNPNRSRDSLYPFMVEILLYSPEIQRMIMDHPNKQDVADRIDRNARVHVYPCIRRQLLEATRKPELRPEVFGDINRAIANIDLGSAFYGTGARQVMERVRQLTESPNMIGDTLYPQIVERLINIPEMISLIMSSPQSIDRLAGILATPSIHLLLQQASRNREQWSETTRDFYRGMRNILQGRDANPVPNPLPPLEQVYAAQLWQLQEMGFSNTRANVGALQATAGDVYVAAGLLMRLGSMPRK